MPVCRRLLEYRAAQFEVTDDAAGRQVEVLTDELFDLLVGDLAAAECLNRDGSRLALADGVGDDDLHAIRESGGDAVLGDIACRVGCGAVNLRRVLARERAAAVPGEAAVCVHENLATGQAGVAHGAAGYEAAGWVDPVLGVVVEKMLGDDCLCRVLDKVAGNLILLNVLAVLGAHDDGVNALGHTVFVLDGDLRLAVRSEVLQRAFLAELRHAIAEFMGQGDRERHQFRRLVAGKADHHALVARADRFEVVIQAFVFAAHLDGAVNALLDVRGLLVNGDGYAAGLVVESVAGVYVTGVPDCVADDGGDVHIGIGGNLTHDDDEAGGGADLAGDARPGVVGDDGIEHRVRYLVAELIRVSLCDRFGSEQVRGRVCKGMAQFSTPGRIRSYRMFQIDPISSLCPAWRSDRPGGR